MSSAKPQEYEELKVFGSFAEVCRKKGSLRLLPKTARKGTDPPDILCDLESGESLGFELVSCENVAWDPSSSSKEVDVRKLDSDQHKLQYALGDEYRAALGKGTINEPTRFDRHTVHVDFHDTASFKKRQKAVPRVIEILNEFGPGHHSIDEQPIRSIKCTAWNRAYGKYAGPIFSAGRAHSAAMNIVGPIKCKLHKYAEISNDTWHLLAWSTTASRDEMEDATTEYDDLVNYLQENGMGPFERIWIFRRHNPEIVFDSAKDFAA